ncbi:hypothetical protein CHL76_03725 [Marinococcus halophilus]|uniref:YlxP-like protein n=1 Tax=Marinococcus halophilus TaxID=1371 RepID=A0A510Y2C2_MARHA|nr:DUF503 family protein [Marinococcus halophilus]OZT81475.1 hypothetical protein CHL76_03725 [Marinococcus halophilus]GEK57434.1 hypothetical protein MHA01_03390 [Marinococcus halophilus]
MIGVVHVECMLYEASHLKQKRAVLQSVKTKLKQRNLSVAETDYQELWQRAALSIVNVHNEKAGAEKELQRAIHMIESYTEWEITSVHYEWL